MISLFQRLSKLLNDRLLAIGAFLLFIATAAVYNIPTPQYLNLTFGWEYGNIAEALVNGKGYSDAFGVGSGPTAWMPPLFVLLLAGAFKLFGVKTIASMWAMLIIKYAGVAASLYALLSIANRTPFAKYKYILALIFIFLVYINRDAYFVGLHDDWLVLFLSTLIVAFLSAHINKGTQSNIIPLGILAFLLPLASPALAAAFLLLWAGMIVLGIPRESTSHSRWRTNLGILAIFTISMFMWTARNYQVFETFIPLKSNLWFDFYQANYYDDDGLLNTSTFALFHPIGQNEVRDEYFREKEARFIEHYKALSFEKLSANPSLILPNIVRRAASAFLFMQYSEDLLPITGDIFISQDIQKLRQANLISTHELPTVYWTSLNLTESEFKDRITPLALNEESIVITDWREQKDLLTSRKNDWKNIFKSLLLSFAPTLCIIFGSLIERIRRQPVFILTILLYLAYLAPYILVAYYRRYQSPMIGLHAILFFLCACIILETFLPRLMKTLEAKRRTKR